MSLLTLAVFMLGFWVGRLSKQKVKVDCTFDVHDNDVHAPTINTVEDDDDQADEAWKYN